MDQNQNRIVDGNVAQIPVRVSVNLGKTSETLQRATSLLPGEVVELNRRPSDCVYIYVDGVLYAEATLQVIDGVWAAHIDKIMVPSNPDFLDIIEPQEDVEVVEEVVSSEDEPADS